MTWFTRRSMLRLSGVTAAAGVLHPYRGSAADKSVTVLSLRAFLQTPHARMPDLHLTREEVDDLASYILSLRAG